MVLRIDIFGAGSIGQRHFSNLQALGVQARLVPYRSLGVVENYLADAGHPDGAVVATATDIRAQLIAPLAAANIPVYIEKPVAIDPTDLQHIQSIMTPIADRSMVGFMMRYHPVVQSLAQMDLSDIYHAMFEIGHDVTQWRTDWVFEGSYAAASRGGGVLLDLCHEIDIAKTLLPHVNMELVHSLGHDKYPAVDFATQIMLSGNCYGSISMDYLSDISLRRIALRGQEQLHDIDLLRPIDGFERNTMFMNAMSDFLHLIQGRAPKNPIAPVYEQALGSCHAVAWAWANRKFVGHITKDI